MAFLLSFNMASYCLPFGIGLKAFLADLIAYRPINFSLFGLLCGLLFMLPYISGLHASLSFLCGLKYGLPAGLSFKWPFLSVVLCSPTFLSARSLVCIFCSALMVVCVLLVLILPTWQLSLCNT
jgi:hypothetical protein